MIFDRPPKLKHLIIMWTTAIIIGISIAKIVNYLT